MNAVVTGFTIAYGTGSITVEDVSKPIWFGDYHKGKLAIYTATLDIDADSELAAMITMVAIYYDKKGNEFVMSSHYEKHNHIDAIVADFLARVITNYLAEVSKNKQPSIMIPGPDTLQ